MLNTVFSKLQQSTLGQEPLQDATWSDTLSGMTELEALIAIKDQIKHIDFTNLKDHEQKLEQVFDLDADAYYKSKKVSYNYLISLGNSHGMQHDVYVVASEYHRQLYTAYSQLFDALQLAPSRKLQSDTVKQLLARYLNAIFMMLKWRYFKDQSAMVGVWTNVHKIIKTAEELALMNKSFFLYGSQVKETSIAAILERGLMLDTLHQGHYSPLEIELTDRILKVWSANPIIGHAYKANQYQFFMPLEHDQGPQRIGAKRPVVESCYWSTTRLVELMESYLCAAEMRKSVSEFGLDAIASIKKIVRLLKKLRLDWHADAYSRQRRSEERDQKNSLLNIHYGFEAIHDYLMRLQKQRLQQLGDGSFTFDLQSAMREINQPSAAKTVEMANTENWWMVDESTSGFAIDFGRKVPDWVEIGMLVCYSEPGYQTTFNIAEVRSIRKLANGAYRAGLKKISQNTAAVDVTRLQMVSTTEAGGDYLLEDGQKQVNASATFSGLLVDNDVMGKPKLLVPLEQFKRNAQYNIAVGQRDVRVETKKVVSKLNDWVLFEVEIID